MPTPETYDGVIIQHFRPCIWGDSYLNKTNTAYLAYGVGDLDGKHYMFVQRKGKKIKILNDPTVSVFVATHDGKLYAAANKMDGSPLTTDKFDGTVQPFLSGVDGDKNAVLNYGGWVKSSHPNGFAAYQTVFLKRKCEMPITVANSMPSFPYFAPGATQIERANYVYLTGCKSIARLQLVDPKGPVQNRIQIDLTGQVPTVVEEEDDEEITFDLQ
jgi:hypothetical protein